LFAGTLPAMVAIRALVVVMPIGTKSFTAS